jgi:flagellar biosynthetic protein FlhB
MAEQTGQERTYPASPRKRQKARDDGHVAKSREISSVMLLGGALGFFLLLGGSWMQTWIKTVQEGLDVFSIFEMDLGWSELGRHWMKSALVLFSPFMILFPLLAVAANVPQVGFHITTKVLLPKLNRISPASGLKRLFSASGFVESLKSIGKILLIGWIAYTTLRPEIPLFPGLSDRPLGGVLSYSAILAFKLVIRVWAALVFLAFLDYLFQHWNFEKELRMTKQEVKEEAKETEGDPQVKARVRSVQMNLARRRMMQEVPSADVVITNPDHVAVALRYDRQKEMAPLVVAKGAGELCERIKQIAREHSVPVVEKPPLARLLYRQVELGREIPVEVYRVVAEILSYVYRLKGKVTDGRADG